MTPRVTYIVSAFNRPTSLPCCLWSLKAQTDPDFEVIVADNAMDWQAQADHRRAIESMNDSRFRHQASANPMNRAWDCYWSAEFIFKNYAKGQWICLPSDDSYYVPVFQEAMLDAATRNNWKFVYCDMLYDRRIGGRYMPLEVEPRPNAIDKTGFLIHRDEWIGFPEKPHEPRRSDCDGAMALELVRRRVPHGKVPEILCVHN